ncbi:MAG: sigma-70 family RNA polymerase sigma factor [Gemmatimonadetes bacterium]|nr:sigma-70 family RNA polymerase sigma factor [Gemmatimonadota bacterium]MYI07764.1 sigma-70 family RNA polymerase sigma factor [Gemmatimonadota bacterium]
MRQRSDAELVAQARCGDRESFGELVRRYQRPAYSVALSVTGKHQDAEDAVQESFMVALQRLDDCRNPDRFAGWLLAIVRNRSRNLIRRENLRSGDEIPVSASTRLPGPDRMADISALRGRLKEALNTLPELQREIVLLHDLEGWKHDEISERIGIPSGTVRSHLHFARKALRARLAEWKDHA